MAFSSPQHSTADRPRTPGPTLGPVGIVAIIGTGLLQTFAMGAIAIILPAIADVFGDGTNGAQIKMVATALGLGMMFGAPLGGVLSDRIGRRNTLVLCALVYGLFGTSIMLATALWQIIAARFIVGLAAGALGVCTAALIADCFAGNARSRWIGIHAGFSTLFGLLVNPLSGALADIHWRYGFALYALALPILIAMLIGIPARTGPSFHALEAGDVQDTSDTDAATSRLPIQALILAAMVGTVATGTSLYWPFRLRELGVELARDLALFALPNLFLIGAAALSYGLVRKRLSISQVFVMTGTLSALGLCVIGFAPTPYVAMFGLACEGLAIGLMTPNITNYALAVSPPELRGRNVGIVKGVIYGSPFFTAFALEPLSDVGGPAWSLWGIGLIAAAMAAAVAVGLLGEKRPAPAAA